METLMKQLAALGLSETQYKVEQHLAELPSFAISYHDHIMRNEPVTITLAMKRSGIDDYQLDAYHLARIIVPDKEIAGINTRSLEDRIKQVNWQKPYKSYSLEERVKIDRIWNDYWLLAKENGGKDVQARLFLKYWKDSQMGSGAPRSGLEAVQFHSSHRFAVTHSLSFTAQEAFDLMDGKTVKKAVANDQGVDSRKSFLLLHDDDPLHQQLLLFELSTPSKSNPKTDWAANAAVAFIYDRDNIRHALSPAEQERWSRVANLSPKIAASDYFQELEAGSSLGRSVRR